MKGEENENMRLCGTRLDPFMVVCKNSNGKCQSKSSLTENAMLCNYAEIMNAERPDLVNFTQPIESQSSTHPIASVENLGNVYDLLQQLLKTSEGMVSNVQFKRDIISKLKLPEHLAAQCVKVLQFLDDAEAEQRVGRKGAKTYYHARSFLSKERYSDALLQTDNEAEQKGQEAQNEREPEQPEKESRQNRQEEARLGVYVKAAMERIYDSENVSKDTPHVFDVHQERPGSSFENVDLIAIDWRSATTVDLVSIEVKLDFSAIAVHQACSYMRFSHRVWVACVVTSEANSAALELRTTDSGLFDYVLSRGIGILACRRTQGRGYVVFPIHWPQWQNPEPVEKELFIERYRATFEQAGVVEKQRRSAKY